MTRDLSSILLSLVFGTVALLAIGACAVAGWTQTDNDHVADEPTVVPTVTQPAATPTPDPTEPPEDEATAAPEPTTTPTPDGGSLDQSIVAPGETRIIDNESEATEEDDSGSNEISGTEEEENPAPATPARLRIDRLGVDAGFEYVGVNSQGNMDAPEGWDNVAWFEPGTIPGMQGNSVVTGHYDRPGGSAAVFFELRNLRVGDRITIVTTESEELVFEVTEIETVRVEDAPLKRIFGDADQRNLNLITCEGAWDPEADMYDERLIVYSTLVE